MHQDNANIRQFSSPLSPREKIRKQIRAVLLAMSALTLAVAATAFFVTGTKAMLAACAGGLSQIVAALVYRRIATNGEEIPAPSAIFGQFMLAEIVKLVTALMLLLAGFLAFGAQALWVLSAAVAALSAYWLVLIF
jgi:F0F1-type ATP synthase assembly protein I